MPVNPVVARAVASAAVSAGDRGTQLLLGLLGAFLSALIMLLLPVMLIITGIGAVVSAVFGSGSQGVPPSGSDAAMIATYEPLYKAAAAHYDVNWYLLASIHKQETGFTTSTLPGVHEGLNTWVDRHGEHHCCAGPMQFNVTNGPPSTWDAYKDGFRPIAGARPWNYPQKRAPHPSVYDDFDAIAAAAAKLRADGATGDLYSPGTYRAVCAYIGSCSNVANCGGPNDYCQVLPRARQWEAEGRAQNPGPHPLVPVLPAPGTSVYPLSVRGAITTKFGEPDAIYHHPHAGIDLAASPATVLAFHAGTVALVQHTAQSGGYGEFVCVSHPDLDVASCYAHMQVGSIRVHPKQHVVAGQPLGQVGQTGAATGPHLHFEIRTSVFPLHSGRDFLCPASYIGLADFSLGCIRAQL